MNKSLCSFLLIFCLGIFISSSAHAFGYLGKIVVLTDDLLNGKGIFDEKDYFDKQLQASIRKEFKFDMDVKVIAQDGATTISSMALIPMVLAENPDLVVIAIGYNDALAQNDPDVIYNNLDNLLRELERAGAYIMLIGIEAPAWMDHDYATRFNSVYPRISSRYHVMYHNGFIKGVQYDPKLTQEDRYHPNGFGIAQIVKNITPGISPIIDRLHRIRVCSRNPNAYKCDEYIQELDLKAQKRRQRRRGK